MGFIGCTRQLELATVNSTALLVPSKVHVDLSNIPNYLSILSVYLGYLARYLGIFISIPRPVPKFSQLVFQSPILIAEHNRQFHL